MSEPKFNFKLDEPSYFVINGFKIKDVIIDELNNLGYIEKLANEEIANAIEKAMLIKMRIKYGK